MHTYTRNANCHCSESNLKKLMDENLKVVWGKNRELFWQLLEIYLTIPYHKKDCSVYSSIVASKKLKVTLTFSENLVPIL